MSIGDRLSPTKAGNGTRTHDIQLDVRHANEIRRVKDSEQRQVLLSDTIENQLNDEKLCCLINRTNAEQFEMINIIFLNHFNACIAPVGDRRLLNTF